MNFTRILGLACATALFLPGQNQDSGKFRLHKFLQPIGEESYETKRKADLLSTEVTFEFTDRRTKVPLKATIETNLDLTPTHFVVKGSTSRFSKIDDEVTMSSGQAAVLEGKSLKSIPLPKRFFTVAGYSPVSAQMLMLRYWMNAGKPASLPLLPSGQVTIVDRGRDEITVNGTPVSLERYSVSGIIWGQEILWTDAAGSLVALVGVDAEFDHFEAIREGYESALPAFVSRAATDSLARLTELTPKAVATNKGTVAFTGAQLIDGNGGSPVQNATVLIDRGRILAAGPAKSVKVPRGATIIDAKGKTILPGLWDMHAHFEQVGWGPIYLAAGVTTVRDNGNELEFITTVRDALRAGKGVGPALLLAGIVDGDSPSALGVVRANTLEQAKSVVQRYHDSGFEQIKVYQSVKPEIVKALAEEAHRIGMTVTGHVPSGMTLFDAVNAGMDMISHMYPSLYLAAFPKDVKRLPGVMPALNPEAPEIARTLAFLKEHGTVIDSTMTVYELSWHDLADLSYEPGIAKVAPELAEPLKSAGIPAASAKAMKPGFDGALKFISMMQKAGIPIVVGTDQTVPGHSVYREMELYVKGGLTPMEAIQAATIVPARAMHLDRETGTVEKGKRADLIVVDGNPLRKIEEIRTVDIVVANGRIFDTATLWKSVGFQP